MLASKRTAGQSRSRNADSSNCRTSCGWAACDGKEYTYDDGDNLVTKVMPFEDNVANGLRDDGNITGWTSTGTWSATSNEARNVDDGTKDTLYRSLTDDDMEIRFDYSLESESTYAPVLDINFRCDTSNDQFLLLRLETTQASLRKFDGGWTTITTNTSVDSAEDTRYSVRIVADGASVQVYQAEDGGLESKIIDVSTAPTYNGDRIRFLGQPDTETVIDDIMILADDLEEEVTYAYNNANELTSMTDYNGTVTFTYDNWGRISKYRGV